MPIEFYSPVSGGAIATIIAMTARSLIAMGHSVDVLSRVDDTSAYPIGTLHALKVRQRESMGLVERKLRGVENRLRRWAWPAYGEYLSRVRNAMQSAGVQRDDCVISFNDLHLARHVHGFPNHWVWLQNECFSDPGGVRRTLKRVKGVLCCSEYIRRWTMHRYGVPADMIHTLHSGVDTTQFSPASRRAAATGLRCLFVGRLDPNKGVDVAVRAVASLARRGVDISLTVVGSTWFYGHAEDATHPYVRQLHQLAEGAPVAFLGHRTRDQLPDIYRDHDIVLVLSRSNEPFGLVTLEAMASGCVVIASNRGGLPEACGGAALLVDPDDHERLGRMLEQLALSPWDVCERKNASIARGRSADWHRVAESLLRQVA